MQRMAIQTYMHNSKIEGEKKEKENCEEEKKEKENLAITEEDLNRAPSTYTSQDTRLSLESIIHTLCIANFYA